jgi:hypothetical protein
VALEILRLWDGQQTDSLGERVLEQKLQSAYRHASVADEDDAITAGDIKTPDELVPEYDTYIEKLKSHRIRLGWPKHLKFFPVMRRIMPTMTR